MNARVIGLFALFLAQGSMASAQIDYGVVCEVTQDEVPVEQKLVLGSLAAVGESGYSHEHETRFASSSQELLTVNARLIEGAMRHPVVAIRLVRGAATGETVLSVQSDASPRLALVVESIVTGTTVRCRAKR